MRRLPTVVFVTAAAIGFAGCSGDAEPAGSSDPEAKVSKAPARKKVAPRVRSTAVLKKALLAGTDLPKGFAVDTGEDNTVKLKSSADGCADLVKLMNAEKTPGAKTIAKRTLVYNKALPVISQELDAMGTPAAAAALQKRLKSAVASCEKLTLLDSGKTAPLSVRATAAAPAGKNPAAVRFTVTGGELKGLPLTFVTTAVDDVLIAIMYVGAADTDVKGGTVLAVAKARKALAGGA